MESTSENVCQYQLVAAFKVLPLLQMCRMHYECDRPSLFVASRFRASSAPPFPNVCALCICTNVTNIISIINSVIVVSMFTFEDVLAYLVSLISDHSVLIAIASIINLNIIVKGRHHQKKKIFWALPEKGGRGEQPESFNPFYQKPTQFSFLQRLSSSVLGSAICARGGMLI